jgi:hypothetical protein
MDANYLSLINKAINIPIELAKQEIERQNNRTKSASTSYRDVKAPDTEYRRQTAQKLRDFAARARVKAQRGNQIANKDYRKEADRDALAASAAKNNQTIAQMTGGAGSAEAAIAGHNQQDPTPQYNIQMNRGDTQFEKARESDLQADLNEVGALDQEGTAAVRDYDMSQDAIANAENKNISNGANNNAALNGIFKGVTDIIGGLVKQPGSQTSVQSNMAANTTGNTANQANARVANALSGAPEGVGVPGHEDYQAGVEAFKAGDDAWAKWADAMNTKYGNQPGWLKIDSRRLEAAAGPNPGTYNEAGSLIGDIDPNTLTAVVQALGSGAMA